MEKEGWGKKKAYWSGDTADLEIGQDVQDAEDEEDAAEVSFIKLRHQSFMKILAAHTLKMTLNNSGASTSEVRPNARKRLFRRFRRR